MTPVPVTEGEIAFNVPEADNKQCSTFYKVLGELGPGPTLIGLHGVSLIYCLTKNFNKTVLLRHPQGLLADLLCN